MMTWGAFIPRRVMRLGRIHCCLSYVSRARSCAGARRITRSLVVGRGGWREIAGKSATNARSDDPRQNPWSGVESQKNRAEALRGLHRAVGSQDRIISRSDSDFRNPPVFPGVFQLWCTLAAPGETCQAFAKTFSRNPLAVWKTPGKHEGFLISRRPLSGGRSLLLVAAAAQPALPRSSSDY